MTTAPVDVGADARIDGAASTGFGDEPQPRRHLVFVIVAMALVMAAVDSTIVATALSSIQKDLHAQVNWSSWTITIYALGQVVMMPLAGRMSDMFGRKRIFVAAGVLFTLASLCCGLATNIYMLVVLRAVQALGGGAFMPSATGIVAEQYGRERDRAVGMFTSIFPIGGIVGPILGGVFVAYLDWRWIFFVNVPVGILMIAMSLRFIPSTSSRAPGRVDGVGIALFGATIFSAMLGISFLGSGSVEVWDAKFLVPEIAALVAATFFVRHARVSSAPFIPINLLVGKGFGTMNLINLLFGSAAIGFGALVPLYAQYRFGISELDAGTLLTTRAAGTIAVAGLAVSVLRRTGYRLPMMGGFAIVAVGMVLMDLTPSGISHYMWLGLSAGITGIGMGLAMPASNNATLHMAEGQLAAVAGLRGMFRQSGAILAVSIASAIVARSSQAGSTLGIVFVVFAAMLVLTVPLTLLVPERRGRW